MIDLYGSMGHIELMEEYFHNVISKEPTAGAYNTLIMAYGKCNFPDRAEAIARRMLHKESTTKASIRTLNTLLNCWAISGSLKHQEVAAERAFVIYSWMKDNQQCIDLKIEPGVVTFATLMKCVIATASSRQSNLNRNSIVNTDIADHIETILQEMNQRFKNGDATFKPHVGIYSGAIKALLKTNDYQRAEDILTFLEEVIYQEDDHENSRAQSSSAASMSVDIRNSKKNSANSIIPFTMNTYIMFFKFYSQMRRTVGAQRAEKLHNHMRQLSIEKSDPKISPNVQTYNLILEAWANLGDSSHTPRLWNLYEQMVIDKVHVGNETYKILVTALSKSDTKSSKHRLKELIRHIYTNRINTIDGGIYMIAIKNRIKVGDITAVTEIMNLLIDSYIRGDFIMSPDRPDRATFNWIISTFITRNELDAAIIFVEEIMQLATGAQHAINGATLDVSWIGPDLNVMIHLRMAWTKKSSHKEKDYNIAKLDNVLLPALVRLINIDKQRRQQRQPKVNERQQNSSSI